MPVRVGINAHGFRTAVRDYTAPTVVEEIAANSYDADAKTVLVLLDSTQRTARPCTQGGRSVHVERSVRLVPKTVICLRPSTLKLVFTCSSTIAALRRP
jgi:hypothetical protein